MKKKGMQSSFALMQIGLWGSYGFLFSYANKYLIEGLFLSNTEAGLILGISTALAFLLQPILTAAVDHTRLSCRGVMLLSIALMGFCSLALLLFQGLWPQLLLYCAACVALQVQPSFSNALGMSAIHRGYPLNFGLARGLGSVSFGVGAQLAVPLMNRFGLCVIPAATAVLCLLLFFSVLPFSEEASRQAAELPDSLSVFFRKNKSFALFLAATVLLYIGHNVLSNCMFQIAAFKGNADAQGTALMIAAFVELPTMFLFTRMLKWLRCGKWVCISGVFFTLRLLFCLLLPGVKGLYLAQLAQMLGYALFAVCSVYYVGELIDKRNVVKGQTYLGVCNTLGTLIAHFLGGLLIDFFGVSAMLLICIAVSVAGTLLLFAAVLPDRSKAV